MRKQFQLPGKFLRNYVDRYWSWESSNLQECGLPRMIPGSGLELIFNFSNLFKLETASGHIADLTRSNILCLRHTPIKLGQKGPVDFMSIRFRAGAFRHFCGVPQAEMIDVFPSAEDLWGRDGVEFEDRIFTAKNRDKKIEIIEKTLLRYFGRYHKEDKRINYAVETLYYSRNDIKPEDLANQLNVSVRQFQRLFHEAEGITPKYFRRISRFIAVLKNLLLNKKKEYLWLALDNGYYDQAHFCHDFKEFVGDSPSSFLNEKNFMSHFYNTKLPR
jgi:AraC-like DNA-binding protein